ncbi:glycoside hydrolase family 5 protein [Microbacterium sp. SS28]|uniref:glycoside hydrolase family 5 protein n=1 Tax=Microbacterium sp. SS28 TaxID=2919948 RepID=UPI001FA9BCC2|nr:cellulase family glycosylhydrolase [Microbacterium sp. SS28]
MTHLFRPGFVRAEGTALVDDAGPLLLRGVGLGNWLLPEGYMWGFGDDLASPRQIEAHVLRLVGESRAAEFWRQFRETFIAEDDFAMIARAGFDHVRLPINSRGLLGADGDLREDGFALIERAVQWSEAHGLRILLDLHGAPGGQTGTNIDDSPRGIPELFMDASYRAQTIELWVELARRYRDREAVLGYDLLNEPLPNEWQHRYNDELVALYRDLTRAVRAADDAHLIMYEGSHWATNWTPLRDRFDDNQALQFHRYWCPPDESSIADFLQVRDELETPVYMGEGGENTPAWIYAATRLYERHGIGWNFWPWKKLATRTSPLSAERPDGWESIADIGADPKPSDAWAILENYLQAIRADQCVPQPQVIDALFARPTLELPGWAGMRGQSSPLDRTRVPTGMWHHTAGEPYDDGERVTVRLDQGEWLAFPLAEEPTSWRLDADAPDAVDVTWDGRHLVLHATTGVEVRALAVERTDSVGT